MQIRANASGHPVPFPRSERHSAREFQTIEQMASFIENLPDYSHQQASCCLLMGASELLVVQQGPQVPSCAAGYTGGVLLLCCTQSNALPTCSTASI